VDIRYGDRGEKSHGLTFPVCVWCFDVHYLSQNAELALAPSFALSGKLVYSNCRGFPQSLYSRRAVMASIMHTSASAAKSLSGRPSILFRSVEYSPIDILENQYLTMLLGAVSA
jgi:hypothetical protein